jgi:CMP-N-acetylneuraminic acid synthetase
MVVDNGSTYWCKVKSFYEENDFYGKRLVGYKMGWDKSVDLDEPKDFEVIRQLMEKR